MLKDSSIKITAMRLSNATCRCSKSSQDLLVRRGSSSRASISACCSRCSCWVCGIRTSLGGEPICLKWVLLIDVSVVDPALLTFRFQRQRDRPRVWRRSFLSSSARERGRLGAFFPALESIVSGIWAFPPCKLVVLLNGARLIHDLQPDGKRS